MKTFLIITNISKDPELIFTKRITAYLESKGAAVNTAVRRIDEIRTKNRETVILQDTECILVLGGDGTLLQAARDTAGTNIPIMGINFGTLGFLAEVEKNHFEDAIDRLLKGEYDIQKRMMLSANIMHNNIKQEISPALNDITITRCGSLQIIRFSIYVNGQFLCKLSADGVIVATPTGSTGYNMSAGGPIVEPGADLIVLTPICAHTLNSRSIILRAEDEIVIQIDKGRDQTTLTVEANSDGSEKVTMVTNDRITISKSDKITSIVKLNRVSFLETLHKKMSDE